MQNKAVGFDISALSPNFKEHAQRGIGRYARELKGYFERNANTIQSELGLKIDWFDFTDCKLPHAIERGVDYLPLGRQTIKQQLGYPLLLNRGRPGRFDLLHFPAQMDAPSWSNRPTVITVLDLIPLVLADIYSADHPSWRFRFARYLEMRAIRRSSLIFAISQCTADDLTRLLGVDRERILVTPLGVRSEFYSIRNRPELAAIASKLRTRLAIDSHRPIILYVGGIDRRKNYPAIVEVARILRARSKTCGGELERNPPIILMAGRVDKDREYPRLCELIRQREVERDLILSGYLEEDELHAMFREAALFYFPSLYEGFGLPVLEAMAAGLPVVCSNTSSMPEVAGNACELVAPDDTEKAAEKIWSILMNRSRARELSEAGLAQAAKFSWERTGELTLSGYQRVLEGSTK